VKPKYPDISDILARKAAGRRQSAMLSFGEKIALVEALRERVEPLRRLRESRRDAERDDTSAGPADRK
jgi:hypothetical protein